MLVAFSSASLPHPFTHSIGLHTHRRNRLVLFVALNALNDREDFQRIILKDPGYFFRRRSLTFWPISNRWSAERSIPFRDYRWKAIGEPLVFAKCSLIFYIHHRHKIFKVSQRCKVLVEFALPIILSTDPIRRNVPHLASLLPLRVLTFSWVKVKFISKFNFPSI